MTKTGLIIIAKVKNIKTGEAIVDDINRAVKHQDDFAVQAKVR